MNSSYTQYKHPGYYHHVIRLLSGFVNNYKHLSPSLLKLIVTFLQPATIMWYISGTSGSGTPTSRNTPSCQTFWEEIFFGRKKREEKEEIFEKLLLNFEIFFWNFFGNKDKLIEEIFEENVSIV